MKPLNVHLIRLLEVEITYYLVAHIVAGVMLSMGLTNKDITKTWLNRVPVPLPNGVRTENNLDGVDDRTLYIHALYFIS